MRHFTHGLLHFLVRLACVRHAASVDSEPGSNSRLKPDVDPQLTEVSAIDRTLCAVNQDGASSTLPCETDQAKPDRISRLARSTNLSKIHAADPPERSLGIEGPDSYVRVSSNLKRLPVFCASSAPPAFLREPFKTTEVLVSGQEKYLS